MQKTILSTIFSLIALIGLAPASSADTPAQEQFPLPDRQAVEAALGPAVKRNQKALVIGLLSPSGMRVYGFGHINGKPDSPPPDGDTVFEIGSVTKTFTATLLAKLVLAGKIRLEVPIESYLPKTVTMPRFNNARITVLDLATHTSGLPCFPADKQSPFARYDTNHVYRYLSAMGTLPSRPGEHFLYSNLGITLLADALAYEEGTSYEQLVEKEICMPLGLHHTSMSRIKNSGFQLAQGFNGNENRPTPFITPMGGGGAGSLLSTANDLLRYLCSYAGLCPSPLHEAMRLATKPEKTVKEQTQIGLCWNINQQTGIVSHPGETIGFRSFIAFSPTKKIGVVVLAAGNLVPAERIAKQAIQLVMPDVLPMPTQNR